LFFARSNVRAKADANARLHQFTTGIGSTELRGKFLRGNFYLRVLPAKSTELLQPDGSPTLSACLAVYFSPDPDLIESALTIPTQSRLFVQR
jgi:hypothetical protein